MQVELDIRRMKKIVFDPEIRNEIRHTASTPEAFVDMRGFMKLFIISL